MSVINQMLKDLEQRTPDNGQTISAPIAAPAQASSRKIILITVAIFLIINALGFYMWQLINENKSLKEQYLIKEKTQNAMLNKAIKKSELSSSKKLPPRSSLVAANTTDLPSINQLTNERLNSNKAPTANTLRTNIDKANKSSAAPVQYTPDVTKSDLEVSKPNLNIIESKINEPSTKVPAHMSVSRRQLTADELVEQKLAQAERSLVGSNVAKAEQLFQDALIIEPNNKQARKKLAALWFGRKAYQKAINLLSQGISLSPQDSELRIMKAQIYLKQGKSIFAFNTLKPLAALEHQEYQILLANVAQDISQYHAATKAYQLLIKMQPNSGRWHLGLATIFDKDGQFSSAVYEYNLALTKKDLTASSAKFVQQRIQALAK